MKTVRRWRAAHSRSVISKTVPLKQMSRPRTATVSYTHLDVYKRQPEYIFVMDRDAAIGTDGAKLAQEIMENELIMGTEAYQNGNVIYLDHPAVWYTAEGGITALDVMLSDLETKLLG